MNGQTDGCSDQTNGRKAPSSVFAKPKDVRRRVIEDLIGSDSLLFPDVDREPLIQWILNDPFLQERIQVLLELGSA